MTASKIERKDSTTEKTAKEDIKKVQNDSNHMKRHLFIVVMVALMSIATMPLNMAQLRAYLPSKIPMPFQTSDSNDALMDAFKVLMEDMKLFRQETQETLERLEEKMKPAEEEIYYYTVDEVYQSYEQKEFYGLDLTEEVADLFTDYELTKDPLYLEFEQDYKQLSEKYGPIIETISGKKENFYFSYAGEHLGLHSAYDLPEGTFLGVYAGEVKLETDDPNLAWSYHGSIRNPHDGAELVIEGKEKGNYLHYMSSAEQGNVEAFFLPHDNRWYVGFKTTRDVAAFEELFLTASDIEPTEEQLYEKVNELPEQE